MLGNMRNKYGQFVKGREVGNSKDFTNLRFGKLVAQRRVKNKWGRFSYECLCDCGNNCVVDGGKLKSGHSKSCGCLRKENKKNTTHGMSKNRFYIIYRGILSRCLDPKQPAFPSYGGRGIVCEWKTFEEFQDDMFETYKQHAALFGVTQTTIDRINNDGNYSKDNCHWCSRKEQARNTRRTIFLTIGGVTRSLPEWAERYKIKNATLYQRVFKMRWEPSAAVMTPTRKGNYT